MATPTNDPLALTNVNDPAIMEYLLTQGGLKEEAEQRQRQRQMAAQLRERSGGTPQGTRVAGTYVAANPLEHIGAGIANYKAGQQETAAADRLGDLGKQRMGALEKLKGVLDQQEIERKAKTADMSQAGYGTGLNLGAFGGAF